MKRQYWWVVVTYILMQLSGVIGGWLLLKSGIYNNGNRSFQEEVQLATAHWGIISFFVALIIILLILRNDTQSEKWDRERTNIPATIGWIILGVFLALFAQIIAGTIETQIFKVKPESENTQNIIEIIKAAPLFMIVSSIFAPILEEIVFRKILFGTLYKRYNFFIAAIVSSLIFALIHFDPTHLLVYISMGLVFSFLYVKTKRIIVPIMAHVMMNTNVMLITFVLHPYIEKAEKLQGFIGGF
ncbi:CPBP family intramembrane glutamic endopeptidase [Bacillus rhizoplanae]|uniref:CPBP family intramembrane glutamic endopeptidase n=1 Tax=Bacillus rhizoplanae TaxID=2880966 RepID=UPI003D263676